MQQCKATPRRRNRISKLHANPEEQVNLYGLHVRVSGDRPPQGQLPGPRHLRVRRVKHRVRRQRHGNLGYDGERRGRAPQPLQNPLILHETHRASKAINAAKSGAR